MARSTTIRSSSSGSANGHTLRSQTDTEVLVHLYEDFGDELVHALEGMFAFAIWDGRAQRMLVARDRFGEKPLFFRAAGGNLALASELTALRAGLGADPELDCEAIDAFYVYGYVPGPATIAKDISQLPPGHLMHWEWSSGNVIQRRYWKPPLFGSRSVDHMDAIAETETLLERSLRGPHDLGRAARNLPEWRSGLHADRDAGGKDVKQPDQDLHCRL